MNFHLNTKVKTFRGASILFLLLFSTVIYAQQTVSEVALEYKAEEKQYLHDGKPLDGCYKVTYLDDDFVARYYISRFEKGLRGDTVRYYDAKTNSLLNENIRITDREMLHRKYFFDGNLFEEYRTVDGKKEGAYREWYKTGVPRRLRYYAGGLLNGTSLYWDENHRLREDYNYKDNLQDGWSRSWARADYSTGNSDNIMLNELYKEGGSPLVEERYTWDREGMVLIKRTVFDGSEESYSAFKDQFDSTRIDTLENYIEIRDYKHGILRSVERFTHNWTPQGIFENYYPEGGIESKSRYEHGELVAENYYPLEPRTDVRQASLTPDMFKALRQESYNSRHFNKCDTKNPLVITNCSGDEIFYESEEGRRYEYYGYDPEHMFHLAFSSEGDFNNVRYYIVYDGGLSLTLSADCVAVNEGDGTIAAVQRIFDGEVELTFYKFLPVDDQATFLPVLKYTVRDCEFVEEVHWIDTHTLLLKTEESGIRIDMEPGALEPVDEEDMM